MTISTDIITSIHEVQSDCQKADKFISDTADIPRLLENLHSKDNNNAYQAQLALDGLSEESDLVYPHLDEFIAMLEGKSAYQRIRGLTLISANARWDRENKIDEILDQYLAHITDEKPIVARQCIKQLVRLAKHKPELAEEITAALRACDIAKYRDSMVPLLQTDIHEALGQIEMHLTAVNKNNEE